MTLPLDAYLVKFVHLLVVPFDNLGHAWPVLPIYTTLILGELYRRKVSYNHAIFNGFTILWAGANWARHLAGVSKLSYLFDSRALAWIVAASTIAIGIFAIVLGMRRKDKALCEVLGHTRYTCYFLIAFYPMQAGLVVWNWPNMAAILIFAVPCWFLIYLMGRLMSRWVA